MRPMSEPVNREIDGTLRIKFAGGRFDSHAFPASTLAEISRLSRVYVALAEAQWRRDHPDRVRLPKGFKKRFELFLRDVEPGSATAVLDSPALDDDTAPTDPNGSIRSDQEIARQAALDLDEAFIHIIKSGELPAQFPNNARREMGALFASLDPNELPIFAKNPAREYHYTYAIRSAFSDSLAPGSRMGSGQVAGQLVGLHVDERLGWLRMANDTEIRVRFLPDTLDDFYKAMTLPNEEKIVVLVGNYLVKDGEIAEIVSVDDITVLDIRSTQLTNRLSDILSDDLSGECEAAAPEVVDVALTILEGDTCPPGVRIFPFEDGGIELTWSSAGVRRTIEISDVNSIDAWLIDINDSNRNREWHWDSISAAQDGLDGLFDE